VGTLPNRQEVTVHKGTRLRGRADEVKTWPQFFAVDGASDLEVYQQRAAVIYAPQNEQMEAASRAMQEEQAKREPPPIPVDRQLRVRRAFRLGMARGFADGQIVDREDPAIAKVVKESPQLFEIPGRPLAG
jgi:hypothetical protein